MVIEPGGNAYSLYATPYMGEVVGQLLISESYSGGVKTFDFPAPDDVNASFIIHFPDGCEFAVLSPVRLGFLPGEVISFRCGHGELYEITAEMMEQADANRKHA